MRISLSGSRDLTMVNPEWLGRIGFACWLAAGTFVLGVAMLGLWAWGASQQVTIIYACVQITLAGLLLATAGWLAAWWMLASEPRFVPRATGSRAGRTARIYASGFVVGITLILAAQAWDGRPGVFAILLSLLWLCMMHIIGCILLAQLQDLLSRGGARWLRKTVRIAFGVSIVAVMLPCVAGGTVLSIFSTSERAMVVICFFAVAATLFAAVWILAALQFRRLRREAIEVWVSD